ncbi:hypothetical protein [Gaetbulibacter sp. PBL-D1]|uniref:hypothetical protein n=1 Tax=Gaetbulibacter sp. PBL-D1 TaxID=3422594 RepID=UPI003D2F3C67
MNKILLKSCFLLFIVIIILTFFDSSFKRPTKSSYAKEEYNKLKGQVDVAFFGSSHVQSTLNPIIIDSITGLNSFNFGTPAQRFTATIPMVDMVLKKEKLKLAVVDIFEMSLGTNLNKHSKNLQYEALDNVEMSWAKFKAFGDIYGFENILNLSTIIRNHNLLVQSSYYKKADLKELFYSKGFYTSTTTFSNEVWNKFQNKQNKLNSKHKKLSKKNLTDVEKDLINQVIKQFRKAGVPFIFCSAPSYSEQYNIKYREYQNAIAEYLNKLKVPFLDYNNYWKELSLTKLDFNDPNHLNYRGSSKVSIHLSNVIKDELIPDFNTKKLKFKMKNLNDKKNLRIETEQKQLNEEIILDNIEITQNKLGYELKLFFDAASTSHNNLEKYRLGIHIYPKESSKDLVSERSKVDRISYDRFNVLLNKVKENELTIQLNTLIKDYKKTKLFLYDKDKYRGIIGNPIWITEEKQIK